MNERELNAIMYAAVKMTCNELSDDELATLNNCAQLDLDPRNRLGSDKFLSLFDARDSAGVPRMHDVTKGVLAGIVIERLS